MRERGGQLVAVFHGSGSYRGGSYLWFRVGSSRKVLQYRSARVTVLSGMPPFVLEVEFSRDILPEYALITPCAQKNAKIKISSKWQFPQENRQKFLAWTKKAPLKSRTGRIGWCSPACARIYFYDELLKKVERPEKIKGKCVGDVVFYLYRTGGRLRFSAKTYQELQKQDIRGLSRQTTQKGVVVFFLEKGCAIPCQECSRLDCRPIRQTMGATAIVKEWGIQEGVKTLPLNQRKGQIWQLGQGKLLFKFPCLTQQGRE